MMTSAFRPCAPLFLLALGLTGCGEESDRMPVDGREFDGVQYSETVDYRGKVIDGYLVNARVWLDIDGDGQYTPGPMTITLDNGSEIELTSGEPTTMTGEDGEFALAVAELELPAEIGPDLDPRNYPLYALALPGKTLEQTEAGYEPVDRAYLMSAAPGVRNVTPLTTLARFRGLAGLGAGSGHNLPDGMVGMNLLRDYVLAGDERAHAYARSLARFMASQLPDGYNDLLASPGSTGTERFLSAEGAFLMGVSLVQQAGPIVEIVDQAAGGDYARVVAESLTLPEVSLEFSNPTLLTEVQVRAQPERSDTLPTGVSDLGVSALLTFDYTEAGQLKSISADGCLAPSMPELARLIMVEGYAANLPTQWFPAATLSAQSQIHYDNPGVDERLEFDWANDRIYFETATTCHTHEGIVAGSSELGGDPEVTFSWSLGSDDTVTLQASIPQGDGSAITRTLIADPMAESVAGFVPHRLSEDGNGEMSLVLAGSGAVCSEDPDLAALDQEVVTAIEPYTYSGYEPQPLGFSDLEMELDKRALMRADSGEEVQLNRLLRYGFLDPDTATLSHVDATRGFEWSIYYPAVGDSELVPSQPNLIAEAYLTRHSGDRSCEREFEDSPTSAYARLEYRYRSLSEYLVGLLQ